MFNRQIKINDFDFLKKKIENPSSAKHRKYEAIRAIVIGNENIEKVATRYGYRTSSLYSMLIDVKNEKTELFPRPERKIRTKKITGDNYKLVIKLRLQNLSAEEISERLSEKKVTISGRSIERILSDCGFDKLRRRTNLVLGISKKGFELPKKAESLEFDKLEPFSVDCPSAGIFFFIPYILKTEILGAVEQCALPASSIINARQACLSMLLLKLLGGERLSSIKRFDMEPGLGIFAGLNVLPKTTYMNTYSCRCSEGQLMSFQQEILKSLTKAYPAMYSSDYINLDFHSIPHYGDDKDQGMENVWCGAKHQTMKGANTVLAQDAASNLIMYARADILRSEEANEVKKFVEHWKTIKGRVDETLVFDCKFTTYSILDDLNNDGIKFITLRKRHASLLKKTAAIDKDEWKRLYIPIPKRKRKHVSVHESKIKLGGCSKVFRQIIVRDHGRAQPTFIILNNFDLSLKEVLIVYAKRWRIENKIAEAVAFFNLNALSSPLMIRIHFDILWTFIADSLYHIFAQDLRRFEDILAPSIFKKFIDMPGKVVYDGKNFQIKIRKRSYTPILMRVKKISEPFSVPWLDNKTVEIVWTP